MFFSLWLKYRMRRAWLEAVLRSHLGWFVLAALELAVVLLAVRRAPVVSAGALLAAIPLEVGRRHFAETQRRRHEEQLVRAGRIIDAGLVRLGGGVISLTEGWYLRPTLRAEWWEYGELHGDWRRGTVYHSVRHAYPLASTPATNIKWDDDQSLLDRDELERLRARLAIVDRLEL